MIADLFKFLTKKELEDRLREMGLRFEQLAGGKLCLLDEELNESGICFYFDMNGNIYKAVVETDYIGDKSRFKEFLRAVRDKYGLKKDVSVEVKVKDFLWLDDLENRLVGKTVFRQLGRECVFDDELNAEVCFDLGRKYGRDVVRRVKVKTTFLGGKERFKQFLERLKRKYGLPRTIEVDVITVPEEKLEETRWWYERGHV